MDVLGVELGEHRAKRPPCHVVAGLDRVVAVHQHLGLDDRHDARLLAERRVPREGVRVRVEACVGRDAVPDRDHGAPLREARAELVVLLEPRAQAVEPLGDLLAGEARHVVRARVDLDPRDDALAASSSANGVPSSAAWRIVSS